MVAHGVFHEAGGFGRSETVLGLALELGIADKDAKHDLRARHHVIGGKVLRLFRTGKITKGAQPLGQRSTKARLVRAPVRGGHGVAIPAGRSIGPQRPGHRPFHATHYLAIVVLGKILLAGEEIGGDTFALPHLFP